MTRDDLLALATRVEAATGPDRQIDAEIAAALAPGHCIAAQGKRPGYYMVGGAKRGHLSRWKAPAYTASIDAALTLVPAGWKWSLHSEDDQGRPTAYCVPNMGRLPWPSWVEDIQAATPALALTAAALRARAEEAGDV